MYKRGSIGLFFRGDPTLERYYPLDGNAIDYGKQRNHGTPSSADLIVYPSKFHLGYRFNRDFSQIYKPSPKIEIGDVNIEYSAITIMAWARLKSLPSEGTIGDYRDCMEIVDKFWDSTDRCFELGCHSETPQEDTFFFNLSTDTINANNTAYSTTIATKNKWYLVVGTWSSASGYTKIYVNGKYEGQVAVTGNTVRNNATPLIIGCEKYNNSSTQYQGHFNGDIHEVAIFSRELDKQEINQYYQWATLPFKRYIFPWENKLKETVSLQSTLEKELKETTSLQSLLEKTLKETTSLHSLLETFKKDSVALTSQLEEQLKSTTALWTELEMTLSGADTVALYSLLEKLTQATVSLQTILEKCKGETVALSTFLQYEKVSPVAIQSDLNYLRTQTLALQAELEWASRNTIALRTLFEKTMQSTTSLVSDLRPFKVKHELDNYDKHTSKIHNIKKL